MCIRDSICIYTYIDTINLYKKELGRQVTMAACTKRSGTSSAVGPFQECDLLRLFLFSFLFFSLRLTFCIPKLTRNKRKIKEWQSEFVVCKSV